MKKKYLCICIYAILLLGFISACCFSVSPVNIDVNDDQDEIDASTPKSSGISIIKKVWNYTSDDMISEVAISADGGYVASVSHGTNDNVFFFNTSAHNGEPEWRESSHEFWDSLAISADGNYFVTTDPNDGYVHLYNKTGDLIWYAETGLNDVEISSVDISADGQYIVMGGYDDFLSNGVLFLYDNLPPLGGVGDDKWGDHLWYEDSFGGIYVYSVAISADGRYVVAGADYDGGEGWDNSLFLFNATDGDPIWSYDAGDHIDHVAISDDGSYIVAGCSDTGEGFVLDNSEPEWDWDEKGAIWGIDYGNFITDVDISGDGKWVVFGLDLIGSGGNVFAFDNMNAYEDMTMDHDWFYVTAGKVNSVSMTANGAYTVAGTDYDPVTDENNNTFFLFRNVGDIGGSENMPILSYNTSNDVNSVSISSSGDYFAAGGDYGLDGSTYLFSKTVLPYLLPSGDDDDDDDEDTGAIVIVVVIIVLASIGGGVVVITILIKKGIINVSKLKRG